MKFFNSEIFGEMYQPDNFLELMEIVTSLSKMSGNNLMLWRGQGDIEWPIHSGAYRRLFNSRKYDWDPLEAFMISYEEDLLKQARHRGYGVNDGIQLGDVELLAKLQHHGAATRLVDFSKNVLVALWFCVDSLPNKQGHLLGVHNFKLGGIEGVLEFHNYNEMVYDLEEYNHPVFIESPVVSKRIAAQHGGFLISCVTDEKTGSLKLPTDSGATMRIAISPELKAETRKILIQHFDIRNETLFPDLDGFAAFANSTFSNTKEMYRW
jgi:hypothetical protein